jgi:hypothetical protein
MKKKNLYVRIAVHIALLCAFALSMYAIAPEFYQRPILEILLAYFGCMFFPAYSAGRLSTYAELGQYIQAKFRRKDKGLRVDRNNPQDAPLLTMMIVSGLFFMILYALKLKSQHWGFMIAGIAASCAIGAVLGWDLSGVLIRWRDQKRSNR